MKKLDNRLIACISTIAVIDILAPIFSYFVDWLAITLIIAHWVVLLIFSLFITNTREKLLYDFYLDVLKNDEDEQKEAVRIYKVISSKGEIPAEFIYKYFYSNSKLKEK